MDKARLRCCVPFCRRTTAQAEYDEWICGPHWTAIPKRQRRVYARLRRLWRKQLGNRETLRCRGNRVWEHLKKEAVRKAAWI